MARVIPLPNPPRAPRRRSADGGPAPDPLSVTPPVVDLPPGIRSQPVWVPPGPSAIEVAAGAASGIGTVLAGPVMTPAVLRALGGLVARPAPTPGGSSSIAAARRRVEARAAGSVAALGDPGWFGPESVAWRVHADAALFVAGMTAFALQSLHPLALAGVADHSAFAEDFTGRLRRTAEFVSGVIYGSSSEAEARVALVHRVHERVVGVAPDGRPYSANDPDLLEWVHIGEYLAIGAAYRRFGLHPLALDDLDRYVGEVSVVGEAFGLAHPPRTWAELDAAYQRFRPDLAVGEQAVTAIRFLRRPPGLPAAALSLWQVFWWGAVACLPPTARRLLNLRDPRPSELAACRAVIRSLGAALGTHPGLAAGRARLGLEA